MNKITSKITSRNKRNRTITITRFENGKPFVKYRSVRLPKEEFDYYSNYATDSDIIDFLKTEEYYKL